jgi:hypothetical protein
MKVLRFLPRFRKAYRSLETYAARESWSREAIESYQLERLNALWEHAVAHVPYYRAFRSSNRVFLCCPRPPCARVNAISCLKKRSQAGGDSQAGQRGRQPPSSDPMRHTSKCFALDTAFTKCGT